MRRTQSGAALITALLVVAIATVTATGMALRDHQQVHRATLLQEQQQARQLAMGGEAVAVHLLEDLLDYDELPWEGCQTPPMPVDIEGTQVTARLENLHCRFNLNSLARGEDPPLAEFAELVGEALQETGTESGNSRQIALAVHDWMNPETDDPAYRGLEPPRRSGNRTMTVASELRQVTGIGREQWDALAPWVTALPDTSLQIDQENAPEAVRAAAGAAPPDGDTTGAPDSIRYLRLQLSVPVNERQYFHCAVIDAPNGRTILRERTPCEP